VARVGGNGGVLMLACGIPWQMEEHFPGAQVRAVSLLGCQSWYNWKADALGQPGFTPMHWRNHIETVKQPTTGQIIEAAQHGPRQVWLIGNEPERHDQDNYATPQEYADLVRTWLALVGGRWAGPGILWSDGGRDWLDAYLALGGPIPDVWAVHIYGSETVSGWLGQYEHLQAWLATRRIVRPVWITETNGGADVLRYLAESGITAYWYSARDPFGDNSHADLVNADATELTDLGRLYASLQGASGAGAQMQAQGWLPVVRDA